jgi:chromosomal replication initiator protein
MTEPQFQRFLKPMAPQGISGSVAKFSVPGHFVISWLRKNLEPRIIEALSEELGEAVTLELIAEARQKPASHTAPVTSAAPPPKFSDKYTFDTFVEGQSNRLAKAGAIAAAQNPGTKFNPLFIYGASGLGKTHLLHAIANELAAREQPMSVSYTTAQEFVERFVAALQHGRSEHFRRATRCADVWLVDDVQFILGRDKSQEEMFHTFNHLQQAGKQIVLTSDRPPRDLFGMDDRLRSRFEGGLVADVVAPDTETRTAIVKAKAEAEEVELSIEVCEFLAIHVPGNVRTLEGALTKVIAQASFTGAQIDEAFAKKVVETSYPAGAGHKPTFDKILEEVGSYFDILRRDLLGPSRKADLAQARHICVYLARNITGDSWKRLGERFYRDHTSMIHAYQKISELANKDLETQTHLRNLARRLDDCM